MKMVLEDGSFHDVDSSEMAFNICANNCMRDTLKKARVALIEPIMKLEVEVPEEYQGAVAGHLSSKRGVITASEVRLGVSVILADVPLSPGAVFTVEPWYYDHEDGIAVFVEDVVLVTEDGAEVLTASLPRTPDALERMVGRSD